MQAPACPQPSAPRPARAHARSRPVHWLVTATALAAVVGGAAFLQPSGATATTAPAASSGASGDTGDRTSAEPAGRTGGAPDAESARYPLECGTAGTEVVEKGSADLDGDGRPETVAVVSCAAGMGTPPHGLYVLAHGAAGPEVLETLLDPAERMNVADLAVTGRGISATLLGYSSAEVPRCCPDQRREVIWRWRDGSFRLAALAAPGSV
ncbi:hypothetical protein [Streptomyces zingiberis]|uniref:VCBS repeat-containing protein n=1 Tax=Streptomyces zingiberis TaxID=2053010 RepID=A0ABX1BWE1_9ACTN|nr:hypothetical protein [Streptomyces zingiberis]NJQ01403.1 hypothetical protein [Streptomyces zingiberis]